MQRIREQELAIAIRLEYWDQAGLVAVSRTTVPVDLTDDLRLCADVLHLPVELAAFHSISQTIQTALFPRHELPEGSYLRVLPDELTG